MKSTSKNKPIFNKEITGAANTATDVYNQVAPGLAQNAQGFSDITSSLTGRYGNDPTINAARSHYGDVLSGKYLNNNPQLQGIIDQTGRGVADRVNASIGTRGLTGGSSHSGILAQQLADAEGRLRYEDYANQQGRMDNAAASVGSLGDAEGGLLNQAIAAYQAQTAPLMAANDHAGTIGGLLGQYQKQTQKGSIGGLLGGVAGSALSGWASGGFKGV